jgi:hypothetical protein
VTWQRALRLFTLLGFAAAIGLLVHRLQRSPEQRDLTRYVEVEVPALEAAEVPIRRGIDRLAQAPGLKPEEARKLLVDDVIPRLVKLRKAAAEVRTGTHETRQLNEEYLRVTDRLIEACRSCVRVIDDPKLSTAAGLAQVRNEFDEVRKAYARWDEHVREACVRHRLAPPEARR